MNDDTVTLPRELALKLLHWSETFATSSSVRKRSTKRRILAGCERAKRCMGIPIYVSPEDIAEQELFTELRGRSDYL